MVTLMVTGITDEEIQSEGKDIAKEITRCYLCKRKAGETSLIIPQGSDFNVVPIPVIPKQVIVDGRLQDEDMKRGYLLCDECLTLVEGIAQKNYTVESFSDEEDD